MVDDIMTVSKCGTQSVAMNATLNSKFECKKLRLSHDKSKQLHISKRKEKCNSSLKVHEKDMSKVDSLVYLGDCVNRRGSMEETVKAREIKAVGILSQISSILKNVSLGIYFFKTALILRETMFINGIMRNTESWNYLTKKQIKTFEESDSRLFSTLFCSPRSTNRVMYYIETAKIPLRHVLAKR